MIVVKLRQSAGPKTVLATAVECPASLSTALLKSTCVLPAIALLVNAHMFHWDKELRAIRTVTGAGIGTSASVIYP
jgi:hypothetical protein